MHGSQSGADNTELCCEKKEDHRHDGAPALIADVLHV